MSWIYGFVEQGENRYTKLGVAKDHYLVRFDKTQQCNPVPMEIALTWRLPAPETASECERELKKGRILPKWPGGGSEWYSASPMEIVSNQDFTRLMEKVGGSLVAPLPFKGRFLETLNVGARGSGGFTYQPHIYVLMEVPDTGACKVALSAYNWPTVLAHYATYNPRALKIVGRWSTGNADAISDIFKSLERRLESRRINPLNWFRIDSEIIAATIENLGASSYPRTTPIDDRVHYTKFRVPVA